jgi:hypothetical protein
MRRARYMRKAGIQRSLSMHASRLVLLSPSYMKWFTHAILEISWMGQRSPETFWSLEQQHGWNRLRNGGGGSLRYHSNTHSPQARHRYAVGACCIRNSRLEHLCTGSLIMHSVKPSWFRQSLTLDVRRKLAEEPYNNQLTALWEEC